MSDPAGAAGTRSSENERAYQQLRAQIVEGHHAPGARLVEQRIATELAVSRTPVREALRRLESEGLVVVAVNRGAQVRPLSVEDIADLYEVRGRLEAYAAELAARRGETVEHAALRRAAEAFDALATRPRPRDEAGRAEHARALMRANEAFHAQLLAMGRTDRIRRLVAGAVDLPLVYRALHDFTDAQLVRSSMFHLLITDAVAAREPERAGRLMNEHVLQGRDALLDRLAAHDPREGTDSA